MKQKFNTTWLVLTYNCDNRCNWCYANSNNLKEKQSFPEQYEEGTLNLLESLGLKKVILIGGEPTLYPNLPNLLRKFENTGIEIGLVSNGRKLSDYKFAKELKDSGLKAMSISFSGYCSNVQDKLTGISGSFDEAMAGLENALSAGLRVSSNTVITRDNIGELEKIVDVLGNKVRNMTWNFCGVCLSEDSNNKSMLHPIETAKAFQRIYDYSKKERVKIKLVTPMPFCIFDKDYLERFKKEGIISGGPCQLTHGKNFVIDYNGDILPCTHFNGFPMMNIFENGKVISSEDFIGKYFNPKGIPSQFRTKISRFPSKKCGDDSCKEPCTGGCPLIWKIFKPEEVITSHEKH
jgi:radical SAM protein with 4Fe4S-binding SPASM domain